MKKFRLATNVFVIAVFTFALASIAQAQATRTWVSGVGDDANPCTRTAPCKTWAGAISKTASPGEIDALDPGGFGAVTITKSIILDGGGGQVASILASGVQGIVIQAGSNGVVTIRNLDINGAGTTLGTNGITILSAKAVHIEHCRIYNFSQNGINDAKNTSQSGGGTQLFVTDTYISAVAGGISVSGVLSFTEAVISNCHINGNSSFGISASNGNFLDVNHTEIIRNGGEAIKTDTGAQAWVVGCVLNSNLTGVSANGSNFLLMDTTIISNGTGVAGTVTTFGNNNVRLNGGGNTLPAPVGQQ